MQHGRRVCGQLGRSAGEEPPAARGHLPDRESVRGLVFLVPSESPGSSSPRRSLLPATRHTSVLCREGEPSRSFWQHAARLVRLSAFTCSLPSRENLRLRRSLLARAVPPWGGGDVGKTDLPPHPLQCVQSFFFPQSMTPVLPKRPPCLWLLSEVGFSDRELYLPSW